MLTYLKNTHDTPLGKVVYLYELRNNNSLVRAFRQDSTGIAQIQVTNTYQNEFQRCRQVLQLETITQAEFTNIIFQL
jgi:hypothetical protein